MKRYMINLTDAHKVSGLTAYKVHQQLTQRFGSTFIDKRSVDKYTSQIVITQRLPVFIVELCAFYGLDWRDPDVVQVIDMPEDQDEEKIGTPSTVGLLRRRR